MVVNTRINFVNDTEKENFLFEIENNEEWIYKRLKWLRNIKKLTLEQLFWYFNKYKSYIDKRLIKQEYPCTPEEAFLLSGETVFDTEKIQDRLSQIKPPLKIGYFEYVYDDEKPQGQKISKIRWINDKNGYIRIYQVPNSPNMTKYCIGGDTAGDGSDYFTGHVLDAKTGIQVAVLKRQLDADLYTKQMYCLGKYYSTKDKYGNLHEALISIEANFDTFPIRELQRLGYKNQYIREKIEEYTGKTEKKFGFKTTVITRPTILSNLVQIVRDHIETINDEDTLLELSTIIRNEKGRIEAPEGGHDDQMMGLAIAHEARIQVSFADEEITSSLRNDFSELFSESNSCDYGEELTII